ncbi:MAG TPA: Cys-tRNA(Pro) deacylase [Metalysinibacillus sp.]
MAKKRLKTNAIRLLEQREIDFDVLEYSVNDGQLDGVSVASKINQPEALVYKTLVTHAGEDVFIFVIPVAQTIELKTAAKAVGAKKVEMLPLDKLLTTTGYVRGGCSPVGMKKMYPTIIDSSAKAHDRIIVSAGKVGLQLHIRVEDLARVTHAKFETITQ